MCDHRMIRIDLDGAIVCELCMTRLGAPATQRIEPWEPSFGLHDEEDDLW